MSKREREREKNEERKEERKEGRKKCLQFVDGFLSQMNQR